MTYTEPIGSVAPRVPAAEKIKFATVNVGNEIALLCPVQAYPLPLIRWVDFLK